MDLPGPLGVQALLDRLEINRESVLVIVDGTLVTGDATVSTTRRPSRSGR